jgi:uncharacterized protein (DUF302 family)/uncharacterized protein YceK
MSPLVLRILVAISIAAIAGGCASLRVLARTEPGAGSEAARVFERWVDADGDAAAAATWSRKVAAGVSVREIEEAFASVAAEDNLRPVGELSLSNELAIRSGKAQKFLKLYSYCDPQTARLIVDFSPPMAAFLPCRIAVVEQEDGLWIHAMNMDILIKLGRPMPPDLKLAVQRVRATMLKMLDRAAAGDF